MLLAAAVLVAPVVHDLSHSRTRISFEGAHVSTVVELQNLSLAETEGFDPDGDVFVSEAEIAELRDELERYWLERLRYFPGDRPGEGAELAGELLSVEPFEDAESPPELRDWLRLRLRHELPRRPAELTVESQVLLEANPLHRDLVTVTDGEHADTFALGLGSHHAVWYARQGRAGQVFGRFLLRGVGACVASLPLWAFGLALALALARGPRRWPAVVLFTGSASVALGLAGLGYFTPPHALLHLVTPLAVAFTALAALLTKESAPTYEPAVFGLAFGAALHEELLASLQNEPLLTAALAGFDLGCVLFQLAWLGLTAGLVRLAGLPERARRWLAVALAALGLYWFVDLAWL